MPKITYAEIQIFCKKNIIKLSCFRIRLCFIIFRTANLSKLHYYSTTTTNRFRSNSFCMAGFHNTHLGIHNHITNKTIYANILVLLDFFLIFFYIIHHSNWIF